ncbi:signal peptidase I [Rhodococcus sp. Rp3]|nr:signal peptidase I [Rhodococcus sp. Rp3]
MACIALVIAAFFFNISLILFKTGSMAPTIPQGSMSVVQRISADDIEVGDVVTVDREAGELPVTHRVIAVHPQRPGEALIEMQGDANPNPDPGPYRVTEVRKVLWSVPGAASVIVWFSDPLILAGLTLGAALLVLWAFWPRKGEFESASTAPIDLKDQQ